MDPRIVDFGRLQTGLGGDVSLLFLGTHLSSTQDFKSRVSTKFHHPGASKKIFVHHSLVAHRRLLLGFPKKVSLPRYVANLAVFSCAHDPAQVINSRPHVALEHIVGLVSTDRLHEFPIVPGSDLGRAPGTAQIVDPESFHAGLLASLLPAPDDLVASDGLSVNRVNMIGDAADLLLLAP
jgi:hypothetical protein